MIEIIEKVIETKKAKQRVYPCRSNRASQLGHSCLRMLVYMRTSWERALLPPIETEFIFDIGRDFEELVIRELKEAGFVVTQQGRDFEMKEQEITGHLDCFISLNGKEKYPCEIKSMSPFSFDGINTADDMLKSDKTWLRNYPAQLQLYMLMSNSEEGLFYLKNKVSGKPKVIWMRLDYDYTESLLKKAETINQHIKNKILPERLNQYKICKDCGFRQMCMPDIVFGEEIGFLNDSEIIKLLNRRAELAEQASEYKTVNKELKEGLKNYMKDREVLVASDWLIEKKINKKGAISFDMSKNDEV